MMRVLLDTNVLLDVLLERVPWVKDSGEVWQAHEQGRISAYVMACAINDIFYIARRLKTLETAYEAVKLCLETFELCEVSRQTLEWARKLPGNDFEDKLQIACAYFASLDAIVTRDGTGFEVAPMLVLSPAELLQRL